MTFNFLFGYLSHTSFYKPQAGLGWAVSHFRLSKREGLAFCDRYSRVYLFSYTKRYHRDLYVLFLDKYAETFPAPVETTKAAEQSRLLRSNKGQVRTRGLYKSVSELWYVFWHSGKRLPLNLRIQGRGVPLCLAARYDGIEAAGPVFSRHGDAVYISSSPALGHH